MKHHLPDRHTEEEYEAYLHAFRRNLFLRAKHTYPRIVEDHHSARIEWAFEIDSLDPDERAEYDRNAETMKILESRSTDEPG